MSSATSLPNGVHPDSVPLKASDHIHDGKAHLLLCASGSVATIKIPSIVTALATHRNLSIRIIFTASAQKFLDGQSHEQPLIQDIKSMPNVDEVYVDEDEWRKPWVRGDPILHIELRRWAHLMVIAPLSANTMAKIVHGICDNLLTSSVRAWDTDGTIDVVPRRPKKVIVVAPAMNTAMWRHPVTRSQLRVLEEEWGEDAEGWVRVISPVRKELACGDVGDGAMADWRVIVQEIEERLGLHVGREGVDESRTHFANWKA